MTGFNYDDCKPWADGKRRAVSRDGGVYVLLCNDAPSDYPIIGYLDDANEKPLCWSYNGDFLNASIEYNHDLVGPAPQPPRVVWVLELKEKFASGIIGYIYASQEEVKKAALSFRDPDTIYRVELPEPLLPAARPSAEPGR